MINLNAHVFSVLEVITGISCVVLLVDLLAQNLKTSAIIYNFNRIFIHHHTILNHWYYLNLLL